ncbi:MAG: hypothetical protein WCH11_07210, partial [Bdellovibrio sp.]
MKWTRAKLRRSIGVLRSAAFFCSFGISQWVLASSKPVALKNDAATGGNSLHRQTSELAQGGSLHAPPEEIRTRFLQTQLQTIETQAAQSLWSQQQARFTHFHQIRWSRSGWHFEALSSSGARCQGRFRESPRLEI